MNSYFKLTLTQFKLFVREPVALFFTIAFPSLLLFLLALVFGNGNSPFEGVPFGYVDFQVPALAGMILGTIALNTIPVTAANNREQGIFRRFKASPMPAWQWMAAEITMNFIVAIISMAFLVLIGFFFFDMRFFGNWGLIFLGFTLCAFSFMAFGYVIASLATTSRVAATVGQLLYIPMFFFSGAAFPLDIMPAGLQTFAQWLPMTHIVLLMQGLWLDIDFEMRSVWILVGMMVIGAGVASRLFRWE